MHYLPTQQAKDTAGLLRSAAQLPSLSSDPAWSAQQGRVLATVVVGMAVAFWLGRKGRWALAIGAATVALVVALRQLRVLEHMARVAPPSAPVQDQTLIAPNLSDLATAGGRPVFVMSPAGLIGPDGAIWTPETIALHHREIILAGDETAPAFWLTNERLNQLGVHALGGAAPSMSN